MDESGSSDCEIVPTGDGRTFHFRVRLSSPTPAAKPLQKRTILAACRCSAICSTLSSPDEIEVALIVCRKPALKASAKVSTHMVLLDKTGSPVPSVTTGLDINISCHGYTYCCYNLKAERDHVEANCLVDNCFVVLCSVDVDCPPPASSVKDLGHDLAMMLDKQDLTDVSFDVGGESVGARCPIDRLQSGAIWPDC
jgi:hypothetical protein